MENWTELEFNLQGFYRRVSFDVVICVLDPCQQSWEQAPWWFGKVKEDPCSSWAPSLLGVCFDLSFVDINMTIAHRGSSGTNTTQSSIGHFRYLKIPTWLVGGIKQKKSQRGWGMNNELLFFYSPSFRATLEFKDIKMAYYIGIQHFDPWQSHLYFSWTVVVDEMYTGYKFLWKL